MSADKITIFCFGASYAVALGLELLQLFWPGPVQRFLALSFGSAGFLAHTLFLASQRPLLASQFGSLLFLAWILAIFYVYGSVHHRRLAWGVFVLPVVLGLAVLAGLFDRPASEPSSFLGQLFADPEEFWRILHIVLFVLAAVGVTVAFVASVMYLLQARRLKAKALPGEGLRLLSLERLELMNRRGINWAFPLLMLGLLIGTVQMFQEGARFEAWTDPRVISTIILGLLLAILLHLRYGFHLRGRRVALLTIMAFGLLLIALLTQHTATPGGGP